MTAPAPDLALAALTARIAAELTALGHRAGSVQQALSLCDFAGHPDPEAIRGLQGIDRITQTLDDLGGLMARIAAGLDPEIRLPSGPLLALIRLHDLALALDPDAAPAVSSEPGEVVWL